VTMERVISRIETRQVVLMLLSLLYSDG